MTDLVRSPIVAENTEGQGPFVILCDHASNRIPKEFSSVGLNAELLDTHIAWDPGALGVARRLSKSLDAPLIWPDASRILIDCNRPPDAENLIVVETERGTVNANRDLSREERARRLAQIHAPYHAAIYACLKRRLEANRPTAIVAIHSFTPIFFGKPRPWQIGVVFGDDRRFADLLIHKLKSDPRLTVGINEPYSPADNVYYTVERQSCPEHLPAVMIEIRNDEISDETDQRRWADNLASILVAAERHLAETRHAMV